MDSEGYVYYRGRYKDMIKTGGENVSSAEIEMFLAAEIPGIRRVVVCATPHEKWGEAVTAIIEAEPDSGLTEHAVQEACRGQIAGYKIPKRVVFIGSGDWVVTPTGKLDRCSARDIALVRIAPTEASAKGA